MKQAQEDDVIEVAAEHFTSKGFSVLAWGANQAGLRFHTGSKTWKAPDLVVYREPIVGVFEAKIRTAQLFISSGTRMSDHDAIVFLLDSEQAQHEILHQVRERLRIPEKSVSSFQLIGGLIAGNELSPSQMAKKESRILYLQVNLENRTVKANGPHSYKSLVLL
jgi:hypothetical protein